MSNILVNIGGSQHVTLSEPHRVNRLGWKKSWRLFPNFYITLSNMRTKLRYPYRNDINQEDRRMFAALRREMYEQQGGGGALIVARNSSYAKWSCIIFCLGRNLVGCMMISAICFLYATTVIRGFTIIRI